jgi:hypothetical protein
LPGQARHEAAIAFTGDTLGRRRAIAHAGAFVGGGSTGCAFR